MWGRDIIYGERDPCWLQRITTKTTKYNNIFITHSDIFKTSTTNKALSRVTSAYTLKNKLFFNFSILLSENKYNKIICTTYGGPSKHQTCLPQCGFIHKSSLAGIQWKAWLGAFVWLNALFSALYTQEIIWIIHLREFKSVLARMILRKSHPWRTQGRIRQERSTEHNLHLQISGSPANVNSRGKIGCHAVLRHGSTNDRNKDLQCEGLN